MRLLPRDFPAGRLKEPSHEGPTSSHGARRAQVHHEPQLHSISQAPYETHSLKAGWLMKLNSGHSAGHTQKLSQMLEQFHITKPRNTRFLATGNRHAVHLCISNCKRLNNEIMIRRCIGTFRYRKQRRFKRCHFHAVSRRTFRKRIRLSPSCTREVRASR